MTRKSAISRLVLTGASSYVGQALVRHFHAEKDKEIHLIIRPSTVLPPAIAVGAKSIHRVASPHDLPRILAKIRPNAVIHHAAAVRLDDTAESLNEIVDANVLWTTHLCLAMVDAGCESLLLTGSTWRLGSDGEFLPRCLYAASKNAALEMAKFFVARHRLKAINLDLGYVFGPLDIRPKLFNQLCEPVAPRPLDLSGGEQKICPVYISDVVRCYDLALKRLGKQKTPALASFSVAGDPITLRKAVEHFQRERGQPLDIRWGALPNRPLEIMRPVRAPRLPGWRPLVPFPKAVSLMMESYRRAKAA